MLKPFSKEQACQKEIQSALFCFKIWKLFSYIYRSFSQSKSVLDYIDGMYIDTPEPTNM